MNIWFNYNTLVFPLLISHLVFCKTQWHNSFNHLNLINKSNFSINKTIPPYSYKIEQCTINLPTWISPKLFYHIYEGWTYTVLLRSNIINNQLLTCLFTCRRTFPTFIYILNFWVFNWGSIRHLPCNFSYFFWRLINHTPLSKDHTL